MKQGIRARRLLAPVVAALLAQGLCAAPAAAKDTPGAVMFRFALAAACRGNPDILAARARTLGVGENYAQARAGFLPTLSGEAAYETRNTTGAAAPSHADPKTLSLVLTQPLYRGGSTAAGVREATAGIEAQRERLRAVEQRVLFSAVRVYMDTVRDQEILRFQAENEKILAARLEAARGRFSLGAVTRTDVDQSEARLAAAAAARAAAQASLRTNEAAFESIVGLPSGGGLQMPPQSFAPVTESLDAALAAAVAENPGILAARKDGEAARAAVRSVEGERLPRVDLTGQVSRIRDPEDFTESDVGATSLVLRATVPLYAGGRTSARVRQSSQTEYQRRHETEKAVRDARLDVEGAWQDLTSARARAAALEKQVAAARQARDGVRTEADYGTRSTLDTLNAEQEYLAAQVALASARRDAAVAAYSLLLAEGRLTPEILGLEVGEPAGQTAAATPPH